MLTSKEAYQVIFGEYGLNDAAFKIWEAAVKWERGECEDIVKRYRQRNSDNTLKKVTAENILKTIQRRSNK